MAKRYDIMTPRAGKDGKTYWTRIGTAWTNDKGGTQLVFDALPIPDKEGRVVASLFEPRERDGGDSQRQQGRGGAPAQSWGGGDDLDDSIPFATRDSIW